MINKILIICLPFLLGPLLADTPELSIAWSLGGSVFIACIAQTKWFRESLDGESVVGHLLRPESMFHFMFVGYHVIGGAFHALNGSGYSLFGTSGVDPKFDAYVISHCQQLMLLAHTSITVGMKLVGFRHDRPLYRLRSIPPYSLILVSLVSLGIASAAEAIPSLKNFRGSLETISSTAILVEVWMCLRYKRNTNLIVALAFLGLNLFTLAVSGWKGTLLFTFITLCLLLCNLMPKRVLIGGAAFLLFWALYFYPFGLALRPLLWWEGVPQVEAVEQAFNKTIDLSLDERLDIIWVSLSDRLNDLGQFSAYVEYVPEVRPYYGSEIIRNSIVALVPRVLWPEKPNLETVSMQRVYEAGVVQRVSDVSAKSNFYQDAYLSAGETGIVLACLLLGAAMMWMSRVCERMFGGYEIGTCLIYTSLFAGTFHMALDFEYFLGSIGLSVILLFGLFFLGRSSGWIVRVSRTSSRKEVRAENPRIQPSQVLAGQ